MRVKLIQSIVIIFLFSPLSVFAEEGHGHYEHKNSMMGKMKGEMSSAVEVGNRICPVSGEEIGGAMGSGVQYEYNGRIYNFCCSGCLEEFKKAPEKYIKIVEGQMKADIGKRMGQHKGMMGEDENEEHYHVMGKTDEHMMMGMDKDESMTEHHQEPMMDEAQVKEINLEAYQFGYLPEEIVVNRGDSVVIHATSRDVAHGISIKEYGINEKVEKGKVKDIKFIADKTGEFDILCSVYCGAGHHKMKAKLIVNP